MPLEPDVIDSQLPPDVTDAVQLMEPPPALETLNVVEPASQDTFRFDGVTSRTGVGSWVMVKSLLL